MQNFRQYLLESVGHFPTVNVQIDFADTISVGERKVLIFQITKFIKKDYNLSNDIEFTPNFDSIIVKILNVPQHLFDTVDFLGDIHDIVLDHFEPVDAYSHIECHWPPAFKMVIQNHLTTIYTNQESIKGIEKLVEGDSAFQLDIRIEPPAKCVGILSLLKVKGFTDRIVINGPDELYNDLRKVNDILHKHRNGSEDIIACQRELIELDLDEYAEL